METSGDVIKLVSVDMTFVQTMNSIHCFFLHIIRHGNVTFNPINNSCAISQWYFIFIKVTCMVNFHNLFMCTKSIEVAYVEGIVMTLYFT